MRIPTHISGDAFFAGRSSRNQPQPGLVGGSSALAIASGVARFKPIGQTVAPDGAFLFVGAVSPGLFFLTPQQAKHVQRFHFALCGAPRLVDAFPDVTRSGIRVFGNVEQDLQPRSAQGLACGTCQRQRAPELFG